MTKGNGPNILVLGSLARNTLLVPLKTSLHDYARQEEWVGAPLIREMICEALVELEDDPSRSADETNVLVGRRLAELRTSVLPEAPDPERDDLENACVTIVSVFKQVAKTSDPKDHESVLRVATHYTCPPERPESVAALLTAYTRDAIAAQPSPEILVVFDFDSASRHAVASTVDGLSAAAGERVTVIGLAGEVGGDALDWMESLSPAITGGPERTVALVRAEELRKAGLIIIESGPIERTVRDLLPYFDHPPLRTIAGHAQHVIILFEEVGAIYIELGDAPRGSIHLASNTDWIAHEHGARFGRTPGRMSITLAAAVRQLAGRNLGARFPDLSNAVRLSIAAFNRYFLEGYDPQRPLSTLQSTLSYHSREQLKTLADGRADKKPNRRFFMSSLEFPMVKDRLNAWTRLDAVLPDGERAAERLRSIVLKGPEAAFRNEREKSAGMWHPQARILCPYMQIGALKTFDEEEIAGFTSLTKLFRKYLQTPAWKAPLSIAVFGPPGTGKSFGIKELIKNVNPAAEKELTFNLSQLPSVDALNDAFHDVQHRVLSSDEVPLVLFDEFDATYDNAWLGWLKYFLAPMQDGVFRGKSTDYRIGRAFFVFAGGTTGSFAEFKSLAQQRENEAKSAKLPDFVSRLQGFLDIQSINPPEDAKPDSPQKKLQRQIKRALLLRSLLIAHGKPILQKQGDEEVPRIDTTLIDAFLNAGRYEHGLRSMESVVRMSKWVDGAFIPASLPAKWLLEMHATGLTVQGPGGPVDLC